MSIITSSSVQSWVIMELKLKIQKFMKFPPDKTFIKFNSIKRLFPLALLNVN